jgi:hypothetical protein
MNATCERLIGTLRREFLDRMLVLGNAHLRTILTEYQAHYNCARPHQGIAQRVPDDKRHAPRATLTDIDTQQIRRKPILGGLISDFTDWLRSRTNKHHRPFQADIIAAYCDAARALSEWMSGHDVNGDFIACDTALLNRFFANYLASRGQTR